MELQIYYKLGQKCGRPFRQLNHLKLVTRGFLELLAMNLKSDFKKFKMADDKFKKYLDLLKTRYSGIFGISDYEFA